MRGNNERQYFTRPLIAITVLCLLKICVLGAPVRQTGQVASFLWKFGYIDEDDIDNNRGAYDPNSPAFQASIRRLQWFGNINVTGRIDAATISLINTERCGVKDPVNSTAVGRFTLQGTTWKKRDLTYRILKFRKDRNLPEEVQRRIFRKAFDLWQSASGLRIREKYWGNADILISFVSGRHEDSYPFDGKGGTLAHAFYPLSNKGLSGDAHFDNDEEFTTGTPNGINLDWVAIHEFGHSLGLEHSNVHESIMYPWYKGYHRDIKLTKDDILGIQALYPKPTDRLTSPEVRTTPKSTTTRRPRVTPRSTRRPRVTPRRPLPSLCGSSIRYDTVFMGPTGWTYFFVGDKYWQLDRKLRRYGPRMINGYWSELKTPVDAAYLNRRRNVVFFKGSEFWEYSSTGKLIKSGNISSYGLPLTLANMDAVFTWEGNNKTYFFKGSKYWKYDDETRRLQRYYYVRYRRYSYPRDIRAVWRFYENVKAAVKWSNGRNYVFWDKQYLKLQKGSVRREVGYPQIISDRCFTFGIGSGVSTALIKGVARAGKGTAEFVVSQEDRLQTKVIKTLKRALQPVISDVSIAWDLAQGWTVEQIPSSLPPLFSGDRLVVYGFLKPSEKASQVGQNEVRLQGTLGKDKKMEHLIMFPTPSTAQGADSDSHSSDFLHCLAAKTFIQMKQGDLTDKYGAELEEAKSPIISISKTVNVVSKFTSFVAVDRDSLLPVSRPLRKQVIPLFGAYGCYSMGLPTPILPYAMSAPPGAAGFSDHSLPSLKLMSAQPPLQLMSAQPPLPASTMVVGGGYPQRPPHVVPYKMACANTCSSVPPPRRGASHAFAFGGGHVQRRPQEVFGGGIPPTRPPLEESYEMKDCYMYPDSPPRASHWMATLGGGCPPSTSAFASQGRRGCILTLITLQRASGAWDLTDQLIALCSTNKDALITGCPTEIAVSTKEGKLLWATALALVLLMFKFLDQKDEWEMIADKGMKWLRRNLPGAVKYDNVLKSAATAAGVQM